MERAEIYKCKDSGSKESRQDEKEEGRVVHTSLMVKCSCSQRWWESLKGWESLVKIAQEVRRRNFRKDEEGKRRKILYGLARLPKWG